MTEHIQAFAEKHGCRQPKKDDCGDFNLQGRRGEIYTYGPMSLGVTVTGPNRLYWNKWRESFLSAGLRIVQNGDCEGAALFDPDNESQTKLALEAIQPYRKRKLTPEHLATLTLAGSNSRFLARKTQIDGWT